MARDRDWVDYANLASNVVQNAQLDSLNSKMCQLAALELQKEYREQQEAALANHENLLRETVFVYTEQLRDVEEVASQNPIVAYIRASHLKRMYAEIPQFKTTGFRKFEDKERLANVQRSCERVIRESIARLAPDDQAKCERCIAHLFERDELRRLIAAQEERESLTKARDSLPAWEAAKMKELAKAKEAQSRAIPRWFKRTEALRIPSVICCAVGAVALMIGSVAYGERDWPVVLMLLTQLMWMFPVATVACLIVRFSNHPSKREEHQRQVDKIKGEIARRQSLLSERDREIMASEALQAKFGTAQPDDSRKLLSERDALLKQALGDFVKRDMGDDLLPEAVEPSIGDSSGVYIFGPHLRVTGMVTQSIEQAVDQLRRFGAIPQGTQNTVHMLDELVDQGYTFIIKHPAGNVEVIGQNVPVRTTPEGMEKAIQLLRLDRQDAVVYRKHTTDPAVRMHVGHLF